MAAIIFDFDGVVIDSQRHWDEGSVEHLARIIPGWSREHDRRLKGQSVDDNHRLLVAEYGLAMPLEEYVAYVEQLALDIYRSRANVIDGIPGLLDRLQTITSKPTIASASRRPWIEEALIRHGLLDRFADITTCAEVPRGKPAPDVYLRAAEKLGLDPAKCVVIEDSTPGVAAAKAAGMVCIGFHDAHHEREELAQADLHISRFDELTIERLGQLLAD